jgi:hypothetical protein
MSCKNLMERFQTNTIEEGENTLGSFPLRYESTQKKYVRITRSTGEDLNENRLSEPGMSFAQLYELPYTSEQYT